jgi:hypothetical protein
VKGEVLRVQLSVETSDGAFESHVSFPVGASQDEINSVVKAWLSMLDVVVKRTQEGKL